MIWAFTHRAISLLNARGFFLQILSQALVKAQASDLLIATVTVNRKVKQKSKSIQEETFEI